MSPAAFTLPLVDRYVSGGSRASRRFVQVVVDGRLTDARRMLAHGLTFLQSAKEAGVSKDYLIDTANGLQDAVSDLIGLCRRDLDNAGIDPDTARIDLTELAAARATLGCV